MILVVLVVFVFLRDARATIIPSIAVPTSLIGTFAVMYLLGYTLDNLSLMAITIATGFVVDDAIVVMENISRHRELGHVADRCRAARRAGDRLHRADDQPVARRRVHPDPAMQGLVGRLFREFAVTLSIAILISMIVSLTATPMLCAYLLRGERQRARKPAAPRERARLRSDARGIAGAWRWVFDNRGLVLVVLLLTIVMNVVLVIRVPKGFFPQQDTGVRVRRHARPQDASFQRDEVDPRGDRRRDRARSGDRRT